MEENLISTNKSVAQLIQSFESGDIAVPEIQRDVVWKPDQIKQLIDSITHGFPCGSLILWEPREKDKSLVRASDLTGSTRMTDNSHDTSCSTASNA
jgi:uncharacterized protein with ParB-like and HNH nuclease domain